MALTGGAAILAKLKRERAAGRQNASPVVIITYASQTGTAQDIAQNINAECNERQIKSKVLSLNDLKFESLSASKSPIVIAVVSTTGDGDPPDNSQRFFKDMKNAAALDGKEVRLKGIRYTCLGLGDSNYTSFMAIPTRFKKSFDDLGAGRFHECREVDEVDGLEDLVESWIDSLWESLTAAVTNLKSGRGEQTNEAGQTKSGGSASAKSLPRIELESASDDLRDFILPLDVELQGVAAMPVGSIRSVLSEKSTSPDTNMAVGDKEDRFSAPVISGKKMTADGSDREVYLLTVDLAESGMTYAPGDSLEIVPENDAALVERLISRLKLDGTRTLSIEAIDGSDDKLPHIQRSRSLRDCFVKSLDICCVLKKTVLRYLAGHCAEAGEERRMKFLVSKPGREAYQKFIISAKASLMDILTCFPSCQPPLDGLLEFLPPLNPRPYSIACSEGIHGSSVRIAYSLAKYMTPYGERWGVTTGWLTRTIHAMGEMKERPNITVGIRSGGAFRLPGNLSKPIILIGPGTGVSPFLGFLEERKIRIREWSSEVGSCWLFFGCRREEEDYLFKEELEAFHKDGTLYHFHVAFSRQFEKKVYVQDLMREHSAALFREIFDSDGYLFVCGDGSAMAQDVHNCLIDICVRQGNVSEGEAKEKLNQKLKNHIYVRDIWS